MPTETQAVITTEETTAPEDDGETAESEEITVPEDDNGAVDSEESEDVESTSSQDDMSISEEIVEESDLDDEDVIDIVGTNELLIKNVTKPKVTLTILQNSALVTKFSASNLYVPSS